MKKLKKLTFPFILLALVCSLVSGKALAQTTLVTLEGVVTDGEGSALPGAAVIVRSIDTGYELSSITRSDGTYIISGIQPGKYEVEVSLTGFATQIRRGLTFTIGAKLKIDFSLILATLEEAITVIAESPMVEVTKSEISSVVDRQKIEDLPLLDRDFADLAILKAGVIGGRTNAMPTGMAEVMIDGMSNENIIQNSNRLSVPADAIQEFRIMTNQFEAEYGHTSGMIRTAITRSGTNEIKGRASYFYRDEVLDTPNYFVNHDKYKGKELPEDQWEKAPYVHNNFAGFLGGPIKKDKAHFFLSYDGLFRTTYETITSPLVSRESIDVPSKTNLALFKLNYHPSEKHLLSFRFSLFFDNASNLGVGGYYTKERAYEFDGNTWELQFNWTFYLADNAMNEFRALYVTDDHNFDVLPEFRDKYTISRPSGQFGKYNNLDQYNFADRYQFVDNLSLFFRNHAIKAGVDFMYIPSGVSVFDMYMPGQYWFNTDAPFDPADAATYPWMFMYNEGDPTFRLEIYEFSAFIQDSWRIHPRLTLNYGLRYSYYSCSGLKLKASDIANFNPRFGFSWDPVGDGRTSISGGIGTYTANPMANIGFPAIFYKNVKLSIIFNPGYPDPFQPNPFAPPGAGAVVFDEYDITSAPVPYSLQMSLGAHREVLTDLALGFDLIWTKGYSLVTWYNKNPVIVGTGFIHEDPTKGNIWHITNKGKSDYKGIYLTLSKRYSHGWSLDVSYTLGKQMGNTERQDRPWTYEPDCWDRAWGRKNTDARHKFTVAGIVDIPWGFQISGILFYRSSYPWNARYPYDKNLDSRGQDYVDYHRNSRTGYDRFYINARISKYIRIDRFSIQLFGEVYNLTNRTSFYDVQYLEGIPGFGEPRSAYDPRLVQLGVRLNF